MAKKEINVIPRALEIASSVLGPLKPYMFKKKKKKKSQGAAVPYLVYVFNKNT